MRYEHNIIPIYYSPQTVLVTICFDAISQKFFRHVQKICHFMEILAAGSIGPFYACHPDQLVVSSRAVPDVSVCGSPRFIFCQKRCIILEISFSLILAPLCVYYYKLYVHICDIKLNKNRKCCKYRMRTSY